MLDTNFGVRYDVSQPIVLTRTEQGRLRWKMCGRIDFHLHDKKHTCSPKVTSACAAIANFSVLADNGFRNTHVIRVCGTCPKSKLWRCNLARPGPWRIIVFWFTIQKKNVISGWECGQQRLAPDRSQVCWNGTLQCDWRKNMFIRRLPPPAQSVALHVTTPALSVCQSRLPCFSP